MITRSIGLQKKSPASIHLRKLEEAGYVVTIKRFIGRKPVSRSKLTAKGRKAFELYVRKIDEFLKLAS